MPRLVHRLTEQIGWAALQTVLLLYTYILGELHTCKWVRIERIELNYYTHRSGRRASRSAFMLRRWLLQLPAMMTLHLLVSGPLRLEDSKATQCYFRMIWLHTIILLFDLYTLVNLEHARIVSPAHIY